MSVVESNLGESGGYLGNLIPLGYFLYQISLWCMVSLGRSFMTSGLDSRKDWVSGAQGRKSLTGVRCREEATILYTLCEFLNICVSRFHTGLLQSGKKLKPLGRRPQMTLDVVVGNLQCLKLSKNKCVFKV